MIQTKISARALVNLHTKQIVYLCFVFLFFKNKCQWPLERGIALYANKINIIRIFCSILLFIIHSSVGRYVYHFTWIMNAVRGDEVTRKERQRKIKTKKREQILNQAAAVGANHQLCDCFENYPRNILHIIII